MLARVLRRKGVPCGAHGGFCAIVPGLEAGRTWRDGGYGKENLGPTDRNGARIHCDKLSQLLRPGVLLKKCEFLGGHAVLDYLFHEPARILVEQVGDLVANPDGVEDAVSADLARRGAAYVLDLVNGIGLAVVPLDGERTHALVLVHARRGADVPLDPSRDAFDHDARLPEEPYGMDGVVALDVEARHDLVGELDRTLDAGVAEAPPQRVDSEVQPFKALRLLGVPEELALRGHVHGNKVGRAHVHGPVRMLLVERLIRAQKPHGYVRDVPREAGRGSQRPLPRIAGKIAREPRPHRHRPAAHPGLAQPLRHGF